MIVPTPAPQQPWRRRLGQFMETTRVQHFIIALIVVNAVILGLETSATVMESRWAEMLARIDQAILAVFVVEIALRMVAHGARFFRDPWSIFDFIVIGIALVPATGPFAVLRALRVLRVLRLVTMLPNMRRVAAGLLAAIPGLASVFAIIALIFYVAAVIATQLFGGDFPDWFGTLGRSAYSLFQIMTLESWSMGIVRPVMELYPYAWAFFIVFILISTFTMLNLFIAVIVNAIQAEHELEVRERNEAEAARDDAPLSVEQELRALREELRALRLALGDGARPGGMS